MKPAVAVLICLGVIVCVGVIVGVLVSQNKASNATAGTIKVWTFWAGAPSPTISCCLDSIQRACDQSKAPFEHVHLDLAKAKRLLPGVHRHPCFCETSSDTVALTSDIVRFHLLETYGGVWIDASILLLAPLDTVIDTSRSNVFQALHNPDNCPEGSSHRFPVIETSMMYSPRRHPLIRAWLSSLNLKGCCNPSVRAARSRSLQSSSSLRNLLPCYHFVYFALYDHLRAVGGIQNIPDVKLDSTRRTRFFAYKTINIPDFLTLSRDEFVEKYDYRDQKLVKLVSRNYKLLDSMWGKARNDCLLKRALL